MTISTLPIAPLAMRAFSAAKFGSKRRLKPIISGVPAASTTFRQRSTRFEARSTGFSQNTALPAFAAGLDQVGMGVGRRADQDRVDVAGGDDRLGVAHLGAGRLGELARGALVDVGERDQRRVGRRGDVASVNLADAPGAEQAETKHAIPPLRPDRSNWSGLSTA